MFDYWMEMVRTCAILLGFSLLGRSTMIVVLEISKDVHAQLIVQSVRHQY